MVMQISSPCNAKHLDRTSLVKAVHEVAVDALENALGVGVVAPADGREQEHETEVVPRKREVK